MNIPFKERKIHILFEFSLILKGIYSILEILGGILTLLISKNYVVNVILSLTQDELIEDPKDLIAHYLVNVSNNLSINSQHFIAIYLLTHGIIKLFLVIGLIKKKIWIYPLSIFIFGLFIIYQLYRYSFTNSIWLLILTIFDAILIWLTLHEYNRIKKY